MYRDFVKKGISSLALASAGVIYKHFGSWRRAKMMAGLELLLKEIGGELPKTDEERKKELIDSLKNYVVKNKKIPMSKPGAKQKELHLPYGVGVYKKLFGSWTNAKKEAQLDSLLKEIGGKLPEEEKRINLIDSLREYVMKNKKIPLAKDKKTDTGLSFSIRTYKNHFGSWNRAKMMAGLDQLLAEIKVKESELVKKEK